MSLDGKIFISTVSIHRLKEIRNIFNKMGARVVDFPMTRIVEADDKAPVLKAVRELEKFRWIVFTSANGVNFFLDILKSETGSVILPVNIKIASIGEKTTAQLEKNGIKPMHTSLAKNKEELAKELKSMESLQNTNVLLPLGNLAPGYMENELSDVASVTRINVYKTEKPENIDTAPMNLVKKDKYDMVLFTSASGVYNFAAMMRSLNWELSPRSACIGGSTAEAAEKCGFICLVKAGESTYEGLAKEIAMYYKKQ